MQGLTIQRAGAWRLLALAAATVVLALDDAGIPHEADARVAVVQRVRDAARAAGLSDDDLVADTLVLAAATQAEGARATLDAIGTVTRDLGLATIAGVSNVSHGLPGRPELNARFLELAIEAGLTAGIVNPSDTVHLDTVTAAAASPVPRPVTATISTIPSAIISTCEPAQAMRPTGAASTVSARPDPSSPRSVCIA